jgi:hypothetical protein
MRLFDYVIFLDFKNKNKNKYLRRIFHTITNDLKKYVSQNLFDRLF